MAQTVSIDGANVNCWPLDNTEWTAEDVGAYACTRTRGVFSGDDCLRCTAAGGRSITIGAGVAWLKRGEFWGVEFSLKKPVTVTLDMASGTLSRYVEVVAQLDFDANIPRLVLRYGELSSAPKKDLPVRDVHCDEIVLHAVLQKAGTVEVTAADIEDLRSNEAYCGVMRDGVNTIPTQQLTAQADAVIAQLRAARDTAESGAAPNGFYLYTHTYDAKTKVHNLVPADDGTGATGAGTNGKMLVTAALASGDTFAVNGAAMPAYLGADAVDELPVGRWVTFVFDGVQIVFGGGGITSKNYNAWQDYSTVEHWTGKYLVDSVSGERQKVYAKRMYATLRAGDNYFVHNIPNIKAQVSLRAMLTDGTLIPKAHSSEIYSIPYAIFRKTDVLVYCGSGSAASSPVMSADLEYTCTDR